LRGLDLLTATQRDATVDLQTTVGVSKEERAFSSAWLAVRKRLAASSIVLTTVTDVVGFLTFLGFATAASGVL
jgi:Mg/Co/Ni transporter MgtE